MIWRVAIFLITCSASALAIDFDSLKDRKIKNEEHYQRVLIAAQKTNAKKALKRLKKKINIDAANSSGATALFTMVEELNVEAVRALVTAGANVNIGKNSSSPSFRALVFFRIHETEDKLKKAEDIIELLLNSPTYHSPDDKQFELSIAMELNNIKLILMYTKAYEASYITKCWSSKSPLEYATGGGKIEILRAFLKRDREALPGILNEMFKIIGEQTLKPGSLEKIRALLIEDQIEVPSGKCLTALDMGIEGSFRKAWLDYQNEYCDALDCCEKKITCGIHNNKIEP